MSLTRKKNNSKQEIRVSCCFVFAFSCATVMQITSSCCGSQIASSHVFYISIFYVNLALSLSQVWSNTATATCPWGDVLVSDLRYLMASHTDYPGLSFCFVKLHTTAVTFISVTSIACYKLGFLAQIFQRSECFGVPPVEQMIRAGGWSGGPECTAVWRPLRSL